MVATSFQRTFKEYMSDYPLYSLLSSKYQTWAFVLCHLSLQPFEKLFPLTTTKLIPKTQILDKTLNPNATTEHYPQ